MTSDWAMVLITTIYVIATCFICWANIRAANASKSQLLEMQRQYAEENRPIITVEVIYVKRCFYGFRFRNAGKLIANDVQIQFSQEFCDSLEDTYKRFICKLHQQTCIIGVGQQYDIFFGGPNYHSVQNKVPATGTIKYSNGGKAYSDEFSIDLDSYATFYSVDSEVEDYMKAMKKLNSSLEKVSNNLAEIKSSLSEGEKHV